MYAVIKETGNQYRFTIWYDTLEKAKAEAERLCQKEMQTFLVVQRVGVCRTDKIPVKWVVG